MDADEEQGDLGERENQGRQEKRGRQEEQSKGAPPCPDCGVRTGQPHHPRCDVARCEACGGQRLTCGCGEQGQDPIPWDGDWPGAAECRRRGWWARLVPGQGWRPCDKGDEGATEDLNRLAFFHEEGHDGIYDRHRA